MNDAKHTLLIFAGLLLISCQGEPGVRRDEFYLDAQRYLQEQRYQEAVIQFRNALQLEEDFLPARLALAKAYQELSRHQNALNEFRKVLELDSSHREAKLEVGKYALQSGRQNRENYSRAREIAKELLESDSTDLEARILLGNAYAGLNDLEQSVDEVKMVLEQDPSNLDAQLNLGGFQLGLHNTQKAEEAFLEALSSHPESIVAHRAAGRFYTLTQDFKTAEHHFRQAFQLDQEESTNMYSLVRFYLITEKPERAEEVFKEAMGANPDWREPRWGLANFYVAQGNVAQGLEMLRLLSEEDPDDRITKIQLAELYLNQNNQDKAEDLVRSLLEVNKNDAVAHYLKGRLLSGANDWDAALEAFDRALQHKDGMIPAFLQKASLHLARHELAQAQEALSEILKQNKTHLGANALMAKIMVLVRKPEDALRRANAVLAVQANNVDALFAQAEANLLLERPDQSKAAFQKLHELEPGNPAYLHRLGWVALFEGKDSEALGYFKRALTEYPDLVDVMGDIIYLHARERHFEKALEEVDRFMKNSSKLDFVHVLRGRIWMEQKNYSQAEKDFRKAVELNRANYQAYLRLGDLQLKKSNLKHAIKEVDQLLEQDERFGPAHLLKAYYLTAADDIPGAIDHYKRALELDPENAIAANNLAWLYGENDQNLAEALGLAGRARRQNGDEPLFAGTLGWIYYKMGNHTLAVDQLLFSVNHAREPNAQNYYHLGMAYLQLGRDLLAKQSLRRAIEIDNNFPGAEEAQLTLEEIG